MSTIPNLSNPSNITEVIMPDATKVEVFAQPRQFDEASEFVQIKSEDGRNLTHKDQADILEAIVKK
jgi:hypothetical protein